MFIDYPEYLLLSVYLRTNSRLSTLRSCTTFKGLALRPGSGRSPHPSRPVCKTLAADCTRAGAARVDLLGSHGVALRAGLGRRGNPLVSSGLTATLRP